MSVLNFRNGTVSVGDVFVSSWGDEQTNVDFYQVVSLHGKTMVSVRKIRAEICGTECRLQSRKPVLSSFCGEPVKRKVFDYSDVPVIHIHECEHAWKRKPDEEHIFTTWG
ncbi:hypothetical protein [Escherichia coli]|jgi:hypothetical protein|uniref:hypothetical protein n=1 Tax=Escherichia coli TaxID=562 RepID=UPI000BE350B8|nr:hypothetical protein [Escherichia coli]EEQ2084842.1 hypothetical protein [Escherichia coli]EEQ4150502.1 hypothetical protein [Escherichia coli]EET9994392.1 hypothetical protein [Escherichia coli]EEV7910577.1 hypothetical protein [Escherichia coli]EEV8969322.1 hypothetical protein [Escherichia coli]